MKSQHREDSAVSRPARRIHRAPQQPDGQPLADHPGHEPIDATRDYLSMLTTITYRVPTSQARRTSRRNQGTKLKPGRDPNERPPM